MLEKSQENPVLKIGPSPAGQVLYFFGIRHTNNPADAQFSHLEQLWKEFLDITNNERIIFIEGAIHTITPSSYEDSIRQHGEAGASQWLAREADIVVICPEPNEEEQRKSLCTLFNPEVVAYTMIIQNLAGWFRHATQSSFDKAAVRSVKREIKFSEIYGFMPDDVWFRNQHVKLFGEQPLEDKNFLNSISDPRKDDTQINTVVSARTKMRNEFILSVIAETWKSGKSIFIVYGKGHLAALAQELRKLI